MEQDFDEGELEMVGAIKIKDGLFIGDDFASKDLEFIQNNKVTRIVNCAGLEVDNTFMDIGVQYLTYFWND